MKTNGRIDVNCLQNKFVREHARYIVVGFSKIARSHEGGQQVYYPTAPKMYVPNLEERSDSQCIAGNMKVPPRTANASRNVERSQWKTTYDLQHTGTIFPKVGFINFK